MLKQVMDIYEILDSKNASGYVIKDFLNSVRNTEIEVTTVYGEDKKSSTDFVKIIIKGKNIENKPPTIGIIGRLGGLGARPYSTGFVSDGDGALCVLSLAYKLLTMQNNGDFLDGDVIITTHVCTDAPTVEHFPVNFMGSPVDMETMNKMEVDEKMEVILSIDTTKGNKAIMINYFAISNTVKSGYILPVSDDLLNIMMTTTGKLPKTFPISLQDITPYKNKLHHINSIMQPSTATSAPLVGVAITTETAVAGCATGATHLIDVENAGRFALEVCKCYTNNTIKFFNSTEYNKLLQLYGSMEKFQN